MMIYHAVFLRETTYVVSTLVFGSLSVLRQSVNSQAVYRVPILPFIFAVLPP